MGIIAAAVFLPHASAFGVQDQASNPCLFPAQADYSSIIAAPSKENSTLLKNMVPAVKSKVATAVSELLGNRVLSLEIVLNPRNQDQFAKCLDSINDPSSPNYHHFLNGTTLIPYLPTPGQKLTVTSYFTSHGYNVTGTSSPFILRASAPVSVHEVTLGIKLKINKTLVQKRNNAGT